MRECVASVAYRYPDWKNEQLPGPRPTPDPGQYEWTDLGAVVTAIEACKAIDCYEYCSCEHPGWSTSGAAFFCADLRKWLTGAMNGYAQAPWEWNLDRVLPRAPRLAVRVPMSQGT